MSEDIEKPSTATPSSTGRKSNSTKITGSGTILPVVEPLDLGYLCLIMQAAKKNPFIAKNGTPRYQREVTRWIRAQCELMSYQFLYCGEVGYNMTKSPPVPIMSSEQKWRPSTFPLSKYQMIYRNYRNLNTFGDPIGGYKFEFKSFTLIEPLVSKTELENTYRLQRSKNNTLSGSYRALPTNIATKYFPNGRGMLRIPDVIRRKDPSMLYKSGFATSNIETVIEIKFPGDRLSFEQHRDYLIIANNDDNNLRLMTLDRCEWRRRGGKEQEEMLAKAKADPMFSSVGESALHHPPPNYKSIEAQIHADYLAIQSQAKKWIEEMESSLRYQMVAIDSTNEDNLRQGWKNYIEYSDMVLNAPIALTGLVAAGTAATVALGTEVAVTSTTVITRAGAPVLRLSPITKVTITGIAANAVSFELAAKENMNSYYFLDKMGQITLINKDSINHDEMKNKDDRLVEIDYRGKEGNILYKRALDPDANEVSYYDERRKKIHYYPERYEYYYYFEPGEEPKVD